jgi:hypothetical protein
MLGGGPSSTPAPSQVLYYRNSTRNECRCVVCGQRSSNLVEEVRAVLQLFKLLLGNVITTHTRALNPENVVPLVLEGGDLVADNLAPVPRDVRPI